MSYTYEAAAYNIGWAGINLSEGWGEDTFLEITPNANRTESTMGADGKATRSKLSDKSATITMNFTQAATGVLNQIYAIAAADDVLGADLTEKPFIIRDSSEDGKDSILFITKGAVLEQIPTQTFGQSASERTITWHCETHLVGSDVDSLLETIQDYLK